MNTRTRTFKTICIATLISVAAAPGLSHAGWWADNNPVKKVVNKAKAAPAKAITKVKEAPGNIQAQVEEVLAKLNDIHGRVEESQPLLNAMKDGKMINNLQEIMTFLNESRQDYDQFANAGVHAFSQDVSGLLYDFGDIASIMQVADGMSERLTKADDLINRMPPQFMYLMHEAMGSSIIDMREQLLQVSTNLDFIRNLPSQRELMSAPEQHQASLCPIVNHKGTKISYQVAKSRIAVLILAVGYINAMTPDDLNVGATAVAGGTVTVSKYPPKYVTETLKTIAEYMKLRLETIHEIATIVCE